MTEAEWMTCTDPKAMLRFLLGTNYPRIQSIETFQECRTSDRKLRLFACACYQSIRYLLPDLRAQAAVELAEQYAEGVLAEDERRQAEASVHEPLDALEERWRASRGAERIALLPTHEALALAGVVLWDQAQKAAYYAASNASHTVAAIANPDAGNADSKFAAGERAEERVQTDMLRCIFGPLPFRSFLPRSLLSWNNGTVVGLAQSIYDNRAFNRMPILANVLDEVGCADAEILGHCRGPGPHVRGCWVVDILLGKE